MIKTKKKECKKRRDTHRCTYSEKRRCTWVIEASSAYSKTYQQKKTILLARIYTFRSYTVRAKGKPEEQIVSVYIYIQLELHISKRARYILLTREWERERKSGQFSVSMAHYRIMVRNFCAPFTNDFTPLAKRLKRLEYIVHVFDFLSCCLW